MASNSSEENQTLEETTKNRGRPKKIPNRNPPPPKPESKLGICFQDESKTGFSVPDLVWGKVRNHPWWPGQIFDPADASDLALKHRTRKKDNFLVAYFEDKTFAWNNASVLKPFQTNFSKMEKQSKSEGFMTAVDASLAEVSRRVGSALSCPCYGSEIGIVKDKIDNAGVKSDTYSPNGDVIFIRNSFDPVKFVDFLCNSGQNPNLEVERLDLVIAKAQLEAFNQFRGCNFALPEFNLTRVSFEEEGDEDINIKVSALKNISSKKVKSKPKPVIEEPSKKLVEEESEKRKSKPKPVIEEPSKKLVEEESEKRKSKPKPVIEESKKIVQEESEKRKSKPIVIYESKKRKSKPSEKKILLEENKKIKSKPSEKKIVLEENNKRKSKPTEKKILLEENNKIKSKPSEKKIVLEENKKRKSKPTEKKLLLEENIRKKKKMSENSDKNEKTPIIKIGKVKIGGPTGSTNLVNRKEKRLDSLGDIESKFKNRKKFLKVGECMLRATKEITKTPSPVLKTIFKKRKSLSKVKDEKKLPIVKSDKKKRGKKKKEVLREKEERENEFSLEEFSSSNEMLAQLCLTGQDPLKGHDFINMVTSFFTKFRDYVAINPLVNEKGRKKKSGKPKSSENEIQDSYWSDLLVSDSNKPEGNLVISDINGKDDVEIEEGDIIEEEKDANVKGNSVISSKKESDNENNNDKQEGNSVISNSEESDNENNNDKQEGNLVISNSEESDDENNNNKKEGNSVISNKKESDNENNNNKQEGNLVISECVSTTLVLNFTEAGRVPSKTDLIGFFTRFGPLKEDETEVFKESSCAEVVFKNRADADVAFKNAGKFDVFGKALVSFRLR